MGVVRRSLRNIDLDVTSNDYATSLVLASPGTVDFATGTCEAAPLEVIVDVVRSWAKVDFEGLSCPETHLGASRFQSREIDVGNEHRAWSATLGRVHDKDPTVEWVVTIRALEAEARATLVIVRLGRATTGGVVKPFDTRPEPPGVIRGLIRDSRIVALDGRVELRAAPRTLDPEEASLTAFVRDELFSPHRRLPIIATTSTLRGDLEAPDPERIARGVPGIAHVVVVPHGATWGLQDLVGDDLKVFGGAARIWWPGASRSDARFEHPLYLATRRPLPKGVKPRSVQDAVVSAVVDVARHRVSDLRVIERLESQVAARAQRQALAAMQATAKELAARPKSDGTTQVALAKLEADVDLALSEMAQQEETINLLNADLAARDDELSRLNFEIGRLNSELAEARAKTAVTLAVVGEQEAEFLRDVNARYAKRFSKTDRYVHPLAELRVGGRFLASLDQHSQLYGKIVDVCAEVGCRRAKDFNGREVHRLRVGDGGGDPRRVRASDGAKAFRCAVQRNTPQAARLHWWEVGDVIEFASVVQHDNMSIPE